MPRPNFVVFMADDMGWNDMACAGARDLQTPNLNRLAAQGTRCTHWYGGGPLCSPSRAAMLTGCDPWRVNVPTNVAPFQPEGVRPLFTPLPAVLRELGYLTLMSGKWHLGEGPTCTPDALGFEDWFGFLSGCVDYYSHIFYWGAMGGQAKGHPRHDLFDNGREVFHNGQYMTDLIRDRAMAQMRRAAEQGRPFFLYVPFSSPHYPLHAAQEAIDRFAHLPRDRQLMAAMLWTMDQAIGVLLDELDALGLSERTMVIFTADHGPSREARNHEHGRDEVYEGGSTAGLRGAKGQVYEGGIRVPGLVRYPGVIPAGSVVDEPVRHQDLLPTCLTLAGGAIGDLTIDGQDVLPVLQGRPGCSDGHERVMRWRQGRALAVRRGRWKLVVRGEAAELYDLQCDEGERRDLSKDHPQLVAELGALCH